MNVVSYTFIALETNIYIYIYVYATGLYVHYWYSHTLYRMRLSIL